MHIDAVIAKHCGWIGTDMCEDMRRVYSSDQRLSRHLHIHSLKRQYLRTDVRLRLHGQRHIELQRGDEPQLALASNAPARSLERTSAMRKEKKKKSATSR